MIRNYKEYIINETHKNVIIEVELEKVANAIAVLCGGEYGVTFWNESKNKVFIMLGDSHPFDESYLSDFIKDIVSKSYKEMSQIEVEIENESYPCGKTSAEASDWKVYSENKFVSYGF